MAESAEKTIRRLERAKASLQKELEQKEKESKEEEKEKGKKKRERKKRSGLPHMIPIIVLVLALVLYCGFQDVMWSGAIEMSPSSYTDPSHNQALFVTQYLNSGKRDNGLERDRIDTAPVAPNELITIIQDKINTTEEKAYGMVAGYETMTALGWTPTQAIGLMACAKNEGAPGKIQYGYPSQSVIDSCGVGSIIHKSSAANPMVIETREQLQALIKCQPTAGAMGAGTAQWTFGRCMTYFQLYLEMYPDKDTYTLQDRFEVDKEMYRRELTGDYKSLSDTVAAHSSTVESNLVWCFFKYEAGFGNYKNSDSVSSYSGRLRTALDNRYETALQLEQMFSEVAK